MCLAKKIFVFGSACHFFKECNISLIGKGGFDIKTPSLSTVFHLKENPIKKILCHLHTAKINILNQFKQYPNSYQFLN